jgi:hypothetical protein
VSTRGAPPVVATHPVVCPTGHWIEAAYGSGCEKSKYTSNCVPCAFCVTL